MDKSASVRSKSIMQKLFLLRILFAYFCVTSFVFAFGVKSLQELHNQNVIRQQYEESYLVTILIFIELQEVVNTLGYKLKTLYSL